MIADPFDNRIHSGVPHAEAFSRNTADENFAARRTVARHVADDDVLFSLVRRVLPRTDADMAARQPLTKIVVRFAFDFERDPLRQERRKAVSA